MNLKLNPRQAVRVAACMGALLLIGACNRAVPQAVAQEPEKGTACSLDGMVLVDYPGPKAQIHYAEGKADFFCDLMELFAAMLMPEQKRRVTAAYVQDMAKADWARPAGHWIDAKTAIYVLGSKKMGSMGPTFGSFGTLQDAEAFVKKEGGKIVHFNQVTPAMVNMSDGAVNSTRMSH